MDSSAIFASPFLPLVFKGFELLEPSDLTSPWQTVRKSTARSLHRSVSQSCLRALLTPHWSYLHWSPNLSRLLFSCPPLTITPLFLVTSSTVFQMEIRLPSA